MKNGILIITLVVASTTAWGQFNCPDGTHAACLEAEDKICAGSTKCVDIEIDCYDKNSCASDTGFVCESDYAEVMNDYKTAVIQHNELAAENAVLREQRLEQKNCVINAASLKIAIRCVRQ
jgi:hypothetical protein